MRLSKQNLLTNLDKKYVVWGTNIEIWLCFKGQKIELRNSLRQTGLRQGWTGLSSMGGDGGGTLPHPGLVPPPMRTCPPPSPKF